MAVVRQRYGVFKDDELQANLGGDGGDTHDLAGHDADPVCQENG